MTARALCVQIEFDPCDDSGRHITESWCGRDTSADPLVFRNASQAVSACWGMNGVSICKSCGERLIRLIEQSLEPREAGR
jgi:hypothetical protein